MPVQYSRIGMIDAVKKYLKEEGFDLRPTYDPSFDPARVPIFGRKNCDQIFVDLINEEHVDADEYFRKRVIGRVTPHKITIKNACSATFYRHFFPKAKIFWAIPDYLEKDVGFEEFKEKCSDNYIGLLEVAIANGNSTVKEIGGMSISLQAERLQTLGKLAPDLTNLQKRRIESYLKKCSESDLEYLVFYPEPRYLAADISTRDEEANISKELINRMSELEKLSYKEILWRFASDYRTKTESDYEIALKVTNELWNRYGIPYPTLHHDYEPVLKLDPRYRDHFLHAFQVFLFGAYIIDRMYGQLGGRFTSRIGGRIEDAWVITATYHDFNYVIEKFSTWTNNFFREALHLTDQRNPAHLQLTESYVRGGYMFKTRIFTNILGIKVDDTVLEFLYDRILDLKDHGLLSGLSLLKYIENKENGERRLTDRVTQAACKAICMHTRDVWHHLSGLAEDLSTANVNKQFCMKKILPHLKFEEDPISFLLILADTLQEQGRERDPQERAELDSLHFRDGKVVSSISFSGKDSRKTFRDKIEELEGVSKFLSGGGKFIVRVVDNPGSQSHNFTI